MLVPGQVWALDYLSALVFALSGALVASRAQLDLVGFVFLATLTAVGGGTIRDLVLDRGAVFWVMRPNVILLTSGAAFVVFWTAHLLESRYKVLLWLDAVALSIAVPAGVGVALAGGFGPVVVMIAGMLTGTMGGLMRDVVANEVPLVLKGRQLYLTAGFGGSLAAVLAVWAGLPEMVALWSCAALTFALRAGALLWDWRLPVYKPRPPRN